MGDFRELSAFLGLDERARRLLHLRAIYEGTAYETIEVGGNTIDAREWEDSVDSRGNLIPARFRKPLVCTGTVDDLIDRLVDLTVGQGRFPAFELEGTPGDVERVEALLGDDGLELAYHADSIAVDLAVWGAACEGFSRPIEQDAETGDPVSIWEWQRLEAPWCLPITVAQVGSKRARQLAAEIAATGAPLPMGEDGAPIFAVPAGARSDDLVFLRYQYPIAEDVADITGQTATRTVRMWYRRDYTADAIVEYRPVPVADGAQVAPKFEALPVEPHGWGVVPLVWHRARGGKSGRSEGRSVITPAVEKLASAIDYTTSFWTQGVWASSAPGLVEIDVEDPDKTAALLSDEGLLADLGITWVGPKAVMKYATAGDNPDVRLLEPTGAGAESSKVLVADLIARIYETAQIVRHNPEEAGGVMSGVALERLNQPTIALVGGYRAILGRGWRRLVGKLSAALVVDGEITAPVSATLVWPRVFALTAEDVKAWTEALSVAVQSAILSTESAVAQLATVLEIEDVTSEAARVLADEAEAMRLAREQRDRMRGGEPGDEPPAA